MDYDHEMKTYRPSDEMVKDEVEYMRKKTDLLKSVQDYESAYRKLIDRMRGKKIWELNNFPTSLEILIRELWLLNKKQPESKRLSQSVFTTILSMVVKEMGFKVSVINVVEKAEKEG